MTDDTSAAGSSSTPIVVPADVQEKFGPIVQLILASESMNDDERRYWIDILPAMSPEQIEKLQEILQREKQQLAAIDAKYAQDMQDVAHAKSIEQIGSDRAQRQAMRSATEEESRKNEHATAEGLFDIIDNA